MPYPNPENKYTYKDYLNFNSVERWEIINGTPYMQAAPTWQHQTISRELLGQFWDYLRDKSCQVFSSPFDLRMPLDGEADEDCSNVFQPDILVICDKKRLKNTGYYGVPHLIIEILSPSTARVDKIYKLNTYEKAGVKEYWIVDPDLKYVEVFIIQENKRYGRPEMYESSDNIEVSIFPDLIIELNSVFDY